MRTAYILGGADCVWDDVARALPRDEQVPDGLGIDLNLPEGDGFIAVNDIGTTWPRPLAAWVSLHGWSLYKLWMPKRAANKLPAAASHWTGSDAGDIPLIRRNMNCITAMYPEQTHGASSGHFAVIVALEHMGFDRAILCGVPMLAKNAHYFDRSEDNMSDGSRQWRDADSFHIGWKETIPRLKGRVFSMSGMTREWLGEPSKEF